MFHSDSQGIYMNTIRQLMPKTLPNNSIYRASNETTGPKLKYVSLGHLDTIHKTNSLVEPFSYSNELETLNTTSNNGTSMQDLENTFNSTLSLYKTTYSAYLNSLQNQNSIIQQYGGTNIQTSDGNKYYINKFGYARQYSSEAWSNKHPSCPPSINTDSNNDSVLAKLYIGEPMIPNMPCNLEGKVIDNNTPSNRQYAYVDETGKKHIFSNTETYQRLISSGKCPKGTSYSNSTIFNTILSGTQVTSSTTSCSEFDTNTSNTLYTQLNHLNDTLMSIAKQIYDKVESLETEETKVEQELTTEKKQLLNTIYNLQVERNKMKHTGNRFSSLDGTFQSISLLNTSLYYQFIMYGVVSVSLGYLIYRNMK